ncbi:hypothetical protein Tco_0775895 [Tanacetum coccineum]
MLGHRERISKDASRITSPNDTRAGNKQAELLNVKGDSSTPFEERQEHQVNVEYLTKQATDAQKQKIAVLERSNADLQKQLQEHQVNVEYLTNQATDAQCGNITDHLNELYLQSAVYLCQVVCCKQSRCVRDEDLSCLMRHSEIHKFCDATLNRVLDGLKSYNNDVKYGYVQRELTNDEVEYLKLFKEEIEVRMKNRNQMRRWEMYVNRRPLGPRRERLK